MNETVISGPKKRYKLQMLLVDGHKKIKEKYNTAKKHLMSDILDKYIGQKFKWKRWTSMDYRYAEVNYK